MTTPSSSVRLTDVAERAGVSLATVSRSLTGTPGVSAAVAERVREVAASMGYVVNVHARSLAGGASTSVGLIVSNIVDPYFGEIARGVIDKAGGAGRTVQVSHAADEAALVSQLRLLRLERVGAIVLAGSGHVDPSLDAAADAELREFVLGGGRLAVIGRHHLEADAVLPDNVAAGRTVGRHLLELGHDRVVVLAGPAELTVVADRVAGLRDVLGTRILRVDHHEFSRAGGVAGTRRLLEVRGGDASAPTAIVATNDLMALGVLAELRSAGIDVPGRFSVVGFDDIDVAADLSPALTTVRVPMAEIGAAAMALLLG
ncbi:MAG: LacI family transcriptional regulator, partial [Frondihabitans sp.]|nr:LacI family transcriptional regulator [Frondihabitans sp.]